MSFSKFGALSAAAIAATLLAAPASAVITTFATFSATNNGNVAWVNNGTGGTNATYRSNGTGGSIYTTTSAQNTQPSQATNNGVLTTFSFLGQLAPFVTNTTALFNLNATATNAPAQTAFGLKIQQGLTGWFSFVSTTSITTGSTTRLAGANLLSGTFGNNSLANGAFISGQAGGNAGSVAGSQMGGTVLNLSSDFLDFANATELTMSFSLDALMSLNGGNNVGLNNTAGNALRSFRATAGGAFSADPAPIAIGIPEPQTWVMLLAGFGLVGLSARRRAYKVVAA